MRPVVSREIRSIGIETIALIAWILPTVARFPRARRYSLGSRIEARVYGVLERLVRAAFLDRSRKGVALDDANIEIEVLRHEFRIAFSLRLVSAGQVEHATRMLDEVGRQIGGWRRSGSVARDAKRSSRWTVQQLRLRSNS